MAAAELKRILERFLRFTKILRFIGLLCCAWSHVTVRPRALEDTSRSAIKFPGQNVKMSSTNNWAQKRRVRLAEVLPTQAEDRDFRENWRDLFQGERAGASESIEPSFCATLKLPTHWRVVLCPRREWSPRERCDIDEARRASSREKANQSNLRSILTLSCPTPLHFEHVPGGNGATGKRAT
jgi:hypothetical protein